MNTKPRILPMMLLLSVLLIGIKTISAAGKNDPSSQELQNSVAGSYPRVWLDAPLDGMIIPNAPYEVVIHAATNNSVDGVEFYVNGIKEEVTEPQIQEEYTYFVYYRHVWVPAGPGEYTLKVKLPHGCCGDSNIVEVKVTVVGVVPPLISTLIPPIVSPTPTNTPDVGLRLTDISRSTDQLFYGNCSPNTITFTVHATQPDQVKYMYLFYRLQDISTGEKTKTNDGLPMNKSGADTWTITLKYSQLENYKKYDESWFIYQFVSQGPNKEYTRSESWGDLNYSICRSAVKKPVQGITITPTWEMPVINPGE